MADRSGVAVSALHFYEREGLIASRRTSGNQRRYARETLRRVAFIRMSQRLGIPLARIRRGAGHAAHRPRPDQQGLGAALGGLAPGPRRPHPAPAAAARQPHRLHRLRLPEPARPARCPTPATCWPNRDPARCGSRSFERMCDKLAVSWRRLCRALCSSTAERRDLGNGAWVDVRSGWLDDADVAVRRTAWRSSRGGPSAGRCTTACSTCRGWSAFTT